MHLCKKQTAQLSTIVKVYEIDSRVNSSTYFQKAVNWDESSGTRLHSGVKFLCFFLEVAV